ncbi:MAG: O-antigen ligase family protein, partial [Dongiaceae bacterium]
ATAPAIVVALYAQATDTPLLAFAVAAAVFGAVYARPRPALALLFASLAVVVAVAPLLAAQLPAPAAAGWVADLPASWRQRVEIWHFTAERIAERPLLGWGFDSARAVGDPISLHPHDIALQVWLELGAPGVLLVLAFAALLWRRLGAWAADRAAVAAAAAALTAYLVFALLSRGAWQEWWLAAAWLLAAALVVTAPPSQQPGRRSSAPRP